MTTPLTDATADRIARMFRLADQAVVSALLVEDCSADLPGLNAADPAALERIRFAVLKLSGGDLNGLQRAVDLANTDWRDVLVAAGFGGDPNAHHRWWPNAAG